MDFCASLEYKLNYKKDISPDEHANLKAELLGVDFLCVGKACFPL